jgi:hypothetical protein
MAISTELVKVTSNNDYLDYGTVGIFYSAKTRFQARGEAEFVSRSF